MAGIAVVPVHLSNAKVNVPHIFRTILTITSPDIPLFITKYNLYTGLRQKEGFKNVTNEAVIRFLDIGKKYLEGITRGDEEDYLRKKINYKINKYNKELGRYRS